LVLFVGLAAGAYSSLFLATPWLVDMKEREPRYRALRGRVQARRLAAAKAAEADDIAEDEADVSNDDTLTDDESVTTDDESTDREVATANSGASRPGGTSAAAARAAQQRRRQGGGGRPGRPSGSRKRR
jgi:preprotein translocase subunit SecF